MLEKTGADGDTVKLLRECDAGVKMGITTIDDVLDKVKDLNLKELLINSKNQHLKLLEKLSHLLADHYDQGKEPNPMAKGMSWIKTNVMTAMDNSDKAIADLIIDGCDMGIKSLSKYLNQYTSADQDSKNIAGEIIKSEEELCQSLRHYL